ncbi:hypothetical protein [Ruegeria arenilitoris]|uniref:hypothetical protein n=1 Tax=Ruegeria arenilitoris TaxID=1173585 RepID=UPI00147A0DF2|nr:hypothetical protein [Ruegeria arenilitoris]
MIRILLLTLGLNALATGVLAKDVPVRSGEHDGFTRLVLSVPAGTNWSLAHRKNGARLAVELDDVEFKTGSVFARLSAGRLEAISQADSGAPLELDFGCDCAATAFLYKDTMIVVDIAAQKALPPPSLDIPSIVIPEQTSKRRPQAEAPSIEIVAPLPQLDRDGLQQRLSTRLLQGADRELVDLNVTPPGPRASAPEALPDIARDLPAHIQVSSILDELGKLGEPPLQPLGSLPACISDAELGFDTWSDGRPFAHQVAELRAGLFLEFDRVDGSIALKLAKLLAHWGFGSEAIQVLQLMEDASPEQEWVRAVAQIIDDQPVSEPNKLRGLQRCDGAVAMWAAMADGQLQDDAQQERMEQAYLRLPEHLRRILGPRLAEIFVNSGQLEAARRVLRSVDRVQTLQHPEVTLAQATVAAAEGDADTRDILLNDVIDNPSSDLEAPLALARLVEKKWAEGGAVSRRQIDLISGYAIELRNSELGPVMARGHALALALGSEFSAAFNILDAHRRDETWSDTRNRILHLAAERADDLTFLLYSSTLKPYELESNSTETSLLLAKRFADLGFAKQARDLTDAGSDGTRRRDRAILRARAALLENRPDLALRELAEDPSDVAERLRAQALTDMGNYTAAVEAWRDIGDEDTAARLSWWAGFNLEDVGAKDTVLGQVIDLSSALRAPVQREPDKPISDAEQLLEASADTRQKIAELLNVTTELE